MKTYLQKGIKNIIGDIFIFKYIDIRDTKYEKRFNEINICKNQK